MKSHGHPAPGFVCFLVNEVEDLIICLGAIFVLFCELSYHILYPFLPFINILPFLLYHLLSVYLIFPEALRVGKCRNHAFLPLNILVLVF